MRKRGLQEGSKEEEGPNNPLGCDSLQRQASLIKGAMLGKVPSAKLWQGLWGFLTTEGSIC